MQLDYLSNVLKSDYDETDKNYTLKCPMSIKNELSENVLYSLTLS